MPFNSFYITLTLDFDISVLQSVLENISIKLGIEKPQHFALVTEDVRLSASQKFQVLSEELTLRQVRK